MNEYTLISNMDVERVLLMGETSKLHCEVEDIWRGRVCDYFGYVPNPFPFLFLFSSRSNNR